MSKCTLTSHKGSRRISFGQTGDFGNISSMFTDPKYGPVVSTKEHGGGSILFCGCFAASGTGCLVQATTKAQGVLEQTILLMAEIHFQLHSSPTGLRAYY